MSDRQPTVRDLQDAVDDWITQWEEGYWPPLSNLARLTEEVGELARTLNHHHGAKAAKADEADGEVAEELGDILFVVMTIANSLDIDLDAVLRQTLEKYDVRDADRWTSREDP
ncbi:MAG: nucleotide pyrophosphohydrolase [Bradymonadaceae bacterium]